MTYDGATSNIEFWQGGHRREVGDYWVKAIKFFVYKLNVRYFHQKEKWALIITEKFTWQGVRMELQLLTTKSIMSGP